MSAVGTAEDSSEFIAQEPSAVPGLSWPDSRNPSNKLLG